MDVSEAIACFYNNQMDNFVELPFRYNSNGHHESEAVSIYSRPPEESQTGQFWQEILERLDYSFNRSSAIIRAPSHDNIIHHQPLLLDDHGSVNVTKKAKRKYGEIENILPRNSSIQHVMRNSNHQEYRKVAFQDNLNRQGKKNSDKEVRRKKCQKMANKITALQKVVSPYGKTDTASVLQEASVFIKVLLKQIQILTGEQKSQQKQVDLQTKGLCLVPLSFMQEYIEKESAALDRFMQLNN